jgi:hypothetical protein
MDVLRVIESCGQSGATRNARPVIARDYIDAGNARSVADLRLFPASGVTAESYRNIAYSGKALP